MTGYEKLITLLKSRRFIAAAVSILIVATNHYGLNLSEEQLLGVVVTFVGWIVGDSLQKTGTVPVDSLPEPVAAEAHRTMRARFTR